MAIVLTIVGTITVGIAAISASTIIAASTTAHAIDDANTIYTIHTATVVTVQYLSALLFRRADTRVDW